MSQAAVVTPPAEKMLSRKEGSVGYVVFNNPERRNLVCTEAELPQDLVGLLAEFRRPRHHLARRARQRDGLADQSNVAVLVVRHVLSAGLCVG